MKPISFRRHRFPPDVLRYAVWLYFRFTLSLGSSAGQAAQSQPRHHRADNCRGVVWVSPIGTTIAPWKIAG